MTANLILRSRRKVGVLDVVNASFHKIVVVDREWEAGRPCPRALDQGIVQLFI
jgi:hypothetical protein